MVSPARSVAAPAYSVKIDSFSCRREGTYTVAEITLHNTGPDMEFAKVYVDFGPETENAYINPTTLPAGAIGSVKFMRPGASECAIRAVQGRNGETVITS